MFPVQLRQDAVLIDDRHTEVVCTAYADRILVVITQLNKPGTMLIANRDATLEGAESFTIRTILGNRESIAEHLIARQIIERIAPHTERPVLFCIGLAKPVLDDFNRNTAFAKEGDGTDEDNRDDFHNNNEEHKRRDFLRKICQVVETCRVW